MESRFLVYPINERGGPVVPDVEHANISTNGICQHDFHRICKVKQKSSMIPPSSERGLPISYNKSEHDLLLHRGHHRGRHRVSI